jgi:hypothetical protein
MDQQPTRDRAYRARRVPDGPAKCWTAGAE